MITKEWIVEQRQRAQMAESVTLPIEQFRLLLDEVEELRRYDARELFRCPRCGAPSGEIRQERDIADQRWWCCNKCWREQKQRHADPVVALLAWHREEEK